MIELERAAKPAVPIVSQGYEGLVDVAAKVSGLPLQYLLVAHGYKSITAQEAIAKTEPLVDDVLRLLTTNPERSDASRGGAASEEKIRFEGADRFDACEKFNAAFLQNDWGDGYPLLPPTAERVDEVLRGTTRKPDDVVCIFPPGNGIATVRKIAINAAMAGCRPEHLPVVIAGLQAILSITPMWRHSFLASTSAHGALFVINGPIAEELGVNGGKCCIGPGRQNAANVTIGRGLALAIRNLGHLYSGWLDGDCLGSTRKFSFCIAENEKESPWEPFSVSQGYRRDQNVITVFSTVGDRDVAFQGHVSPENILRQISLYIDAGHGERFLGFRGDAPRSEKGRLLLLPPVQAQALQEGGFSKKAVAEFLFNTVTRPASELLEVTRKLENKIKPEWRWLAQMPKSEAEKVRVPVVEYPELYHIVVAGSERPKPLVCPLTTLPGSAEITDRA